MYFAFWILLLVLHWASVWLAALQSNSANKKLPARAPMVTTTRTTTWVTFWMSGAATLILAAMELGIAKAAMILVTFDASAPGPSLFGMASALGVLIQTLILYFMFVFQTERRRKRLAAQAQGDGASPA